MPVYRYQFSKPQITKEELLKALERLGDLLKEQNILLELTVAGGIVSLLHFGSRNMTQDVDAIFPVDPEKNRLFKQLIIQVGNEQNLASFDSPWFNDAISFFGLETKSNVIVFRHSHLILKAASWEELLAHKLHAFRDSRDVDDATHLLESLSGKNKEQLFSSLKRYQPIAPHVPDKVFRQRFEDIWERVFG